MVADVKDGEVVRVYKLVFKEDGTADLTMSQAHQAFLIYLARNGGETVMDWQSAEMRRTAEMVARRESIREHMKHLIDMGLISEIPLVLGDRVMLRLTDMGRNIASQLIEKVT